MLWAYIFMIVFLAAAAGLVVVFIMLSLRSGDLRRATNISQIDLFSRGRMKLTVWWIALIIIAAVSGSLAVVLQ